MGCVESRNNRDINDVHPNVFSVIMLDVYGSGSNVNAHLEVSDSSLVFYQQGKDPVRWPLKSLRRYGFEMGIFRFECGRRCPTGAGQYTFKCNRSEQLFNLLQSKLRYTRPAATTSLMHSPLNEERLDNAHLRNRLMDNTEGDTHDPGIPLSAGPGTMSIPEEPVVAISSAERQLRSLSNIDEEEVALDHSGDHLYVNVGCRSGNNCVKKSTSMSGTANDETLSETKVKQHDSKLFSKSASLESSRQHVLPSLDFSNRLMRVFSIREYENVVPMRSSTVGGAINNSNNSSYVAQVVDEPILLPKPFPPPHTSPGHFLPPPIKSSLEEETVSTVNNSHLDDPHILLNYAQLDLDKGALSYSSGGGGVPVSSSTATTNIARTKTATLQNSEDNSICANGVPKRQSLPATCSQQEYSTIDFDRTKALSNTAKLQSQNSMEPFTNVTTNTNLPSVVKSVRPRLNSTLSELASVVTGQNIGANGGIANNLKRCSVISN